MKNKKGILSCFIFWSYIIVLIVFVVIKFDGSIDGLLDRIALYEQRKAQGTDNMNLQLFYSIGVQLRFIDNAWAIRNLIANLLAFVPLGFLLPLAFYRLRWFIKTAFISLLFIFGVETFQYVTLLGAFDVDDIFLNFIGMCIGYIFYKLLCIIDKKEKIVN